MGDNNSKWSNWQRINLQKVQAAHGTQYQTKQNKTNTQSKNEDLEWCFSKEGIQMAKKKKKRKEEKMLNTAHY